MSSTLVETPREPRNGKTRKLPHGFVKTSNATMFVKFKNGDHSEKGFEFEALLKRGGKG